MKTKQHLTAGLGIHQSMDGKKIVVTKAARLGIIIISFFALISTMGPSPCSAGIRFITIGTGCIHGIYFPTGIAIAQIINKTSKQHAIRAGVESTAGSVFNIDGVMANELEFGFAQSDRQYQALNSLAEWAGKGPQKKLRSVFSIHPESITLIAAEDAAIFSVHDLKGKRVNIGNPGSGQRQNAIDALSTVDIDYTKDILAENVKASEAAGLLQNGSIDAFFFTVGHPNITISEATSGNRKVRFVPIAGLDKLLPQYPYYVRTDIPVNLYPNVTNRNNVSTFGVKATFITSADVSNDIVYSVTKNVFENLQYIKRSHPVLYSLSKKGMLQGLTAPIHPGALKYYKEVGLK